MLEALPLVQGRLHPEIGGARQDPLGEGEDALDVQLFEFGGVAIDGEQRLLLVQPVLLAVVRVDVDRLLVEKRIVQALDPLLDEGRLPRDFGLLALKHFLLLLPAGEHRRLQDVHIDGRRLQPFQLVDEQPFEFRLRHVDRSTDAAATVVVGVVLGPPLRPARGERAIAGAAPDELAKRKLRAALRAWHRHLDAPIQDSLHPIEGLLGDERFEISTLGCHAESADAHQPDVHRIPQHRREDLVRERSAMTSGESTPRDVGENLAHREVPARELLERMLDERRTLPVEDEALPCPLRRVEISERRAERPAAYVQRCRHAGTSAVRADIVVELRERREHAFHQLPGGRVVDRLRRRAKRDPERLQMRTQREVIERLARKAREVVDDHKVDMPFVAPAKSQQLLQFRAFRRLRALAIFPKAFEDLESFAKAIFFARLELRAETEVGRLPGIRHADVDDRSDHARQLRPIRDARQAERGGHNYVSRVRWR